MATTWLSRAALVAQMVVEQAGSAPSETLHALPISLDRKVSWKYLLPIGGVIALLVLAMAFFLHRRQPMVLGEKDSVLVSEFTNTTGDPVFDGTLRQGLAVQLEQSPLLSLVSEDRIQHALRLMGQPSDARLTPEIARQICERTASAAVLQGSIASMGSQYVLGLRATHCSTGEVLAEEQAQAARKEDVLNALSQIASKFRTQVGESLTTVEKYDTPLAEATTPSLEALKSYSRGLKVEASRGTAAAIPFFKRAIEIDPKFAIAHAALGLMYGDRESLTWLRRAPAKPMNYEIAPVTTRGSSLRLTMTDAQRETRKRQSRPVKPGHKPILEKCYLMHSCRALSTECSGKKEKAVEEGKKAIQLAPDFAIAYSLLAQDYTTLDRLGEAENILQQASKRKLETPDYIVHRYDIAFLKGDRVGMEREVALGQGNSGAEDWISDHQAFVLAYTGHLQEARRMSRHAADLAQQAAHGERAGLIRNRSGNLGSLFRKYVRGKSKRYGSP